MCYFSVPFIFLSSVHFKGVSIKDISIAFNVLPPGTTVRPVRYPKISPPTHKTPAPEAQVSHVWGER